jgi:hypothetical protein
MSQALLNHNVTRGSLRGREAARSVLLRMAIESDRAERVRQLKADRPDLTWARIAEVVGVKERSVVEWQKTGGMDYGNAKKFAELMGVSIEWLWSGSEAPARNGSKPAASAHEADRLQRIEEKLDAITRRLDDLDADAIERDELSAALLAALRDAGTGGTGRGRRGSKP